MSKKKTLVKLKHRPGPFINGTDGCYARAFNKGICPGISTVKWLNSLGPDDEVYRSGRLTNGELRKSWLKFNTHIEEDKGE